jgi:hypothetical protein
MNEKLIDRIYESCFVPEVWPQQRAAQFLILLALCAPPAGRAWKDPLLAFRWVPFLPTEPHRSAPINPPKSP